MNPSSTHYITGNPITPPFPKGMHQALFGMGCFWGAEKLFWQQPGVFTSAVGYAGGTTSAPSYEAVCSGTTGHNEVVFVVFEPNEISYQRLLSLFWEGHNPTQGMRQGNDIGSQYRSSIYVYDDSQQQLAQTTKTSYQQALTAAGFAAITTEILPAPKFYYAEDYHQQYLAKNPAGYCGLGGTKVPYPY